MFPNHINSPFHTPPNSLQQPLSFSSGSPPHVQRLGFFNAVSSALANEFLNQSGSSGSFFAVDSPESYELLSVNSLDSCSTTRSLTDLGGSSLSSLTPSPKTPLRLTEPVRVFPVQTQAENRSQLRAELSNWVAAAEGTSEMADREAVFVKVISCFHRKLPALVINAPNITTLPACIGFLDHLETLDLSNCRSLRSLPNVMDNFPNLQQLKLNNCQNLTALPATVNALPWFSSMFLGGSGVNIANPLQSRLPSP